MIRRENNSLENTWGKGEKMRSCDEGNRMGRLINILENDRQENRWGGKKMEKMRKK